MGGYAVFGTESFQELRKSLSKDERRWIHKMEEQLQENPYGKILRIPFLREKRFRNKRLYYLTDDVHRNVLIVDFGSKKEQQKTINFIMNNLTEFISYLRSL